MPESRMPLYKSGYTRKIKFDWSRQFWRKWISKHLSEHAIVSKLMFIDLPHSSNWTRPSDYLQVLVYGMSCFGEKPSGWACAVCVYHQWDGTFSYLRESELCNSRVRTGTRVEACQRRSPSMKWRRTMSMIAAELCSRRLPSQQKW